MNESIFFFLHSLANQSPVTDGVIVFAAEYLPWIVIAAGVVFLWIHVEASAKIKWREIFAVFLASVTAYVSAIILKILFATNRPGIALENVTPLFIKYDYAFPSGHATFFAALATAIFLKHKRAGIWFIAAAILVSSARIIAGVHYPVDILGGFTLGAVIAYLLRKI